MALTPGVPAIETPELSLSEGGGQPADGSVRITRSPAGEMLFEDAATSPTTLLELRQPASAHAALTGLDADDHPHYLTAPRHAGEHSSAFNAALLLPADVAGNTTLGAHVGDSSIHLLREEAETIGGAWVFAARPEFYRGLVMSLDGAAGNTYLRFAKSGGGEALLGWDAAVGRLVGDHPVTLTATAPLAPGWSAAETLALAQATTGTMSAGAATGHLTQLEVELLGTAALAPGAQLRTLDVVARLDASGTSGALEGRLIGAVARTETSDAIDQIALAALVPASYAGGSAVGLLAGASPAELATGSLPPGRWAAVLVQPVFVSARLHVAEVQLLADGAPGGPLLVSGLGSPEGVVAAPVGSLYLRRDGSAGATLYVKESGTGATGWAAP